MYNTCLSVLVHEQYYDSCIRPDSHYRDQPDERKRERESRRDCVCFWRERDEQKV